MPKEPKQYELDLSPKRKVVWTAERSLKLVSVLCWIGLLGLLFLIYSWR